MWTLCSAGVICLMVGCAASPTTQRGALLGGALGAGTGAIIGHQSGHAGEGALIGGAAGVIGGAIVGDQMDKRRQMQAPPPPAPPPRATGPCEGRWVEGHYEMRSFIDENGRRYQREIWVPGHCE